LLLQLLLQKLLLLHLLLQLLLLLLQHLHLFLWYLRLEDRHHLRLRCIRPLSCDWLIIPTHLTLKLTCRRSLLPDRFSGARLQIQRVDAFC